MENQTLFYTTTKSLQVRVLTMKNWGREGGEALGAATAGRGVKGARQGQCGCLLAPRVAVRNLRNGDRGPQVWHEGSEHLILRGSWGPWDAEGAVYGDLAVGSGLLQPCLALSAPAPSLPQLGGGRPWSGQTAPLLGAIRSVLCAWSRLSHRGPYSAKDRVLVRKRVKI